MTTLIVADSNTLLDMLRASNEIAFTLGRLWVRCDDRQSAEALDSLSSSFLGFGEAAMLRKVLDPSTLLSLGRIYEDFAILLSEIVESGEGPSSFALRKLDELRKLASSLVVSGYSRVL
jgi:hypothetical protein